MARLDPVTITATRTPTAVSATPMPVQVIDSVSVREQQPNTVADLFREMPGVDVTGVGTNQRRPAIRGLRGQRILLLENGLRLNNTRRQQDFGELPALVDVNDVERVEVVRGPASVLYGTDAMGGAVNIITSGPPAPGSEGALHGSLGYRYGSADGQSNPTAVLSQSIGRFGYRLSGAIRETDDYKAPAGRFGDITLDDDAEVHDSGVRDRTITAALAYDFSSTQRLSARVETYGAEEAGFGFVDPALLGDDQTLVRITYPEQDVQKYTLGYRANSIGSWWADRIDVATYALRNERDLRFSVTASFGPTAPPGAGVRVTTDNHTDLTTIGGRIEASKLLGSRHLLTYGVDAFRDRSENSDTTVTVVTGFGPPQTETETRPQVPNASFRSAGVFVQDNIQVTDRLNLVAGARYQDVRAAPRSTPGIDTPLEVSNDRTIVGTANALYRLTPAVSLVASVGRGFRSANLVERFFEGAVPEGNGFQRRNPDLEPETSVNVEVGTRVSAGRFTGEAFAFRNEIRDGIRTEATGDTVNGLPEFQSVNVDRLRFTGAEARLTVLLTRALSGGASLTTLRSTNVRNPDDPVGDSYSSKVVADLTWREPSNRWWASYVVRHNGEQDDAQIGTSPVGAVFPAFTVHALRGGITTGIIGRVRHGVTFAVENLTNELYAEFSNAAFFRPEPGRTLLVSYVIGF